MIRSMMASIALAAAAAISAVHAAPAPKDYDIRTYRHELQGSAEARVAPGSVLASHVVRVDGAEWLRLVFDDSALPSGAKVRITSLHDGAQQNLAAESAAAWGNTSAYFNGSAVRVELLAGSAGSDKSAARLSIAQVMAGRAPDPTTESQCGPKDNRVKSTEPTSGRLMDVGCTANLMASGCFTTAGHCLATASLAKVVEFNVPKSKSNGSIVHPKPKDQYTVKSGSRKFKEGSIGDDWGVFQVKPNSETGLMPLQAQGAGLSFNANVPAVGNNVTINGYGVDDGRKNQTLQVSNGPIDSVATSSTTLQYKSDTEGGNSGSAVLLSSTGDVVAIHTHGGCSTSGSGANSGTLFTNTGLQNAFAQVCGASMSGPTCDDIIKETGSCKNGQMILVARFADSSHDGEAVTVQVDGVVYEAIINDDRATLGLNEMPEGEHKVKWVEPADCGRQRTVECH